jgi:hypothetical protein
MSDPSFLSYTGPLPGVVGAITGIAGMVMGFVSLRRTNQSKSLDLRLSLRKSIADLLADAARLQPLLQQARVSRAAVAAAQGLLRSGAAQVWEAEFAAGDAEAAAVSRELPPPGETYAKASMGELEAKHVQVHELASRVARLMGKLEASLASDDQSRQEIRRSAEARAQAMSRG